MEQVKVRLKYEICGEETAFPVIVVAAGASRRMGGVNKQLLPLGGVPVIIRTLRRFDRSAFVSRIILVAREEDLLTIQHLAAEYEISRLTDLVAGGADRHASVLNGFARLRPDEEKVLIHDGARPLVSDFVIGNVAQALSCCDAVICGLPVTDTVKRVGENGTVRETVDRTGLYTVQTPQGVSVPRYREICGQLPDASAFTDDAGLFEAAGVPVTVVAGSPRNIKITTPEDIVLAQLYLREEEA